MPWGQYVEMRYPFLHQFEEDKLETNGYVSPINIGLDLGRGGVWTVDIWTSASDHVDKENIQLCFDNKSLFEQSHYESAAEKAWIKWNTQYSNSKDIYIKTLLGSVPAVNCALITQSLGRGGCHNNIIILFGMFDIHSDISWCFNQLFVRGAQNYSPLSRVLHYCCLHHSFLYIWTISLQYEAPTTESLLKPWMWRLWRQSDISWDNIL